MSAKAVTVEGLRAFVAVARAGGFARAEPLLDRTQASISKRVLSLEQALGQRLFERHGPRPPTLTSAGRQLLDMAEPVLEVLDNLPDMLGRKMSGVSAVFRVVAGHSSALHILPQVVKDFASANPSVQVQVRVARSSDLVELLRCGRAEVGVTSRRPPLASDLMFLPLACSPMVAVVPKGHAMERQGQVSLESLSKHPLVMPDNDSYVRSAIDAAFRGRHLTPWVAVEAGGWDVIAAYVKLGCGIGIAPARMLPPGQSLATVKIDPPLPGCETGAVLKEDSLGNSLMPAFLAALHEGFGMRLPAFLGKAGKSSGTFGSARA